MKKNFIKSIILPVVLLAGLSSCGGTKEASLTGYFSTTENSYSYSNFLPTYNYFTLSVTSGSLKVYDDNSYVYSTFTSSTSNIKTGADVASGDFTANSKGFTETDYYGTFTVESDLSIGMNTYTLAYPSRVSVNSDGTYYDSAIWSEDMAESYLNLLNANASYTGKTYDTAPTASEWLETKLTGWDKSGEKVEVVLTKGAKSEEYGIEGKFDLIDLSSK